MKSRTASCFLSFPGVAVQGGSPLAERQRAASSSALQLGEAHSLLPSAAQALLYRLREVLTTWVVSVAVGGEPKKVLVWFL